MEWTKKPSFHDYLEDRLNQKQAFHSTSNSPNFVYSIENLPDLSIKKNPYPVKRISIEERIERYLATWSDLAKKHWYILDEMAKDYGLEKALPWMFKDTFKKLALKVHPDHNTRPEAASDFQKVYKAYTELKKLTANAYT